MGPERCWDKFWGGAVRWYRRRCYLGNDGRHSNTMLDDLSSSLMFNRGALSRQLLDYVGAQGEGHRQGQEFRMGWLVWENYGSGDTDSDLQ